MADVDGTLTDSGNDIIDEVKDAVHLLEEQGILVGLVSGRTVRMLEEVAQIVKCHGPIIAENGGVAKLKPGGKLIDLGYTRRPALNALSWLKNRYPGCIRERYDNSERIIDIVFRTEGIEIGEIDGLPDDVQLLDSGYICHLMQQGISKGTTLMNILSVITDGSLTPEDTLVIGDSLTDLSLFELFPHSVLVPNYRMDESSRKLLKHTVSYISDSEAGAGFAKTAFHILKLRKTQDL